MSNQAVIDAWVNLRPFIEDTFPTLVEGTSLSDRSRDLDVDTCRNLEPPSSAAAILAGLSSRLREGDAATTLTSLKISSLAGAKIQEASFKDSQTVHLPFSFDQIQIQGNYSYSQNCRYCLAGIKVKSYANSGHGAIVETIQQGTLTYIARFDTKLMLTGVLVDGSLSIDVRPDLDRDINISKILNFDGPDVAKELCSKLQNIFLEADFSRTLITLMNQKIGDH